MRAIGTLGCAVLLCGCSMLDQLALSDGRTLDPTKIYLGGTDVITVEKRETDRYACLDGPMMCSNSGVMFECRCRY